MSEALRRFSDRLLETLSARIGASGRVYLAYSGGVDSTVLLDLCRQIPPLSDRLVAVHVHHGLQRSADAWVRHCRETAARAAVGFRCLYVDARANGRESPEEAARNARYRALSSVLDDGDVLLTAQHRDDQLETVLLQLFRGSGLSGLSGMPEVTVLGKGLLIRPLLQASKQEIDAYAHRQGLRWVEDPSNRSDDFDRNFLRNRVLPLLKQRWPAMDRTVSRSAGHCAEADAFIAQAAQDLLEKILEPSDGTLTLSGLRTLDRYRQQLVLRRWLAGFGLKMPSQAFVSRVVNEIIETTENGDPIFTIQGYRLRRYRQRLFCVSESSPVPEAGTIVWRRSERPLPLPGGKQLRAVAANAGIDAGVWRTAKTITVKFRSGGEKIALPGRQGRHSLKKLYQEAGIPPWERPSIPLVYIDGRLAAVADLWIAAEFFRAGDGSGLALAYEDSV